MATVDSTGEVIRVDVESRQAGGNNPFEVRAFLQSEWGYEKGGIYAGYSWGFYKGDEVAMGGTPPHSFSRYLRIGIFYRLK